uniref:Transcriptional regulator n=1 Tax=Gongylonema pulchrum TaxID=637853 RepID=A0A183DMJ5_9BILA
LMTVVRKRQCVALPNWHGTIRSVVFASACSTWQVQR